MVNSIKNPYLEFWNEYDLAKDVIPNIASALSLLASELAKADADKLLNSMTDISHRLQEIMKPYSAQFQELQNSIAQLLPKLNHEDYKSLKAKSEANLDVTLELLQNSTQGQNLEETCTEVEFRITDLMSAIGDKASELWHILVLNINTPMSPIEERLVAYLSLLIGIISCISAR